MDALFKKFYRNFYQHTGGFIPSSPLNLNLHPGDFFQIRNGEIIMLGNIYRNNLISPDDVMLEYGVRQSSAAWTFSDGLTKPYSGRGSGHGPVGGDLEFSRQILAFADKGSFIFKATDPESVKVSNWSVLNQQLIIKLTQTYYSFREVYVITESASPADWTLAVAGDANAELEIATEAENSGLVDIFGNPSAKTIQSKNIEYYHHEAKRKPGFFKAKKLAVQDERLEVFISDLMSKRLSNDEWASNFYDYDFHPDQNSHLANIPANAQASVLDMLRANELNPNTAPQYFKWVDTNFDDIEKLFLTYGD